MEIGWYLRFKHRQRVRALVDKSTVGQVENLRYEHPGRELILTDRGDHIEVEFSEGRVE